MSNKWGSFSKKTIKRGGTNGENKINVDKFSSLIRNLDMFLTKILRKKLKIDEMLPKGGHLVRYCQKNWLRII